MKTIDKLEKLIEQRWGKSGEYRIEYHARNEPMSTGYCYRGYYLVDRTPQFAAVRRNQKSHDWEEYMNGRFIGASYEEARAEILERIPDLPVKRTREQHKDEMAIAWEACDDYQRWFREQANAAERGPLGGEGDEA